MERASAALPRFASAPGRERAAVLALAAVLVMFRSLVYLAFEHAYFDSDQAINGLMAKHLAEGRAFPLFFYGQGYMLAVEAWLAVPWVWLSGATVASLRASLILTNLAVAFLLIVVLERDAGLRPWHGLTASLFFVVASPFAAARLVEAQGGNIEPFLWVLLIWVSRNRPAWLGVLLALGFLNREFTLYAVPVLLARDALRRELGRPTTWRKWAVASAAFAVTWEVVMALQPWADLMGPGTRGAMLGGFAGDPAANLAGRGRLDPHALPARLVTVLGSHLAWLTGVRTSSWLPTAGHDWLAWPSAIAAIVAVTRLGTLVVIRRRRRQHGGTRAPNATGTNHTPGEANPGFAWYLAGVGAIAIASYAAFRTPDLGTARYALLSLLLPIGLVAALLGLEPRAALRNGLVAVAVGWAAVSAYDSGRHLVQFATNPPPNYTRVLVEHLERRGVDVAESNYWVAYKATFIAQERVTFAASDFARIAEYQQLAARHRDRLVLVQDGPCSGGEKVAAWWVCDQRLEP